MKRRDRESYREKREEIHKERHKKNASVDNSYHKKTVKSSIVFLNFFVEFLLYQLVVLFLMSFEEEEKWD